MNNYQHWQKRTYGNYLEGKVLVGSQPKPKPMTVIEKQRRLMLEMLSITHHLDQLPSDDARRAILHERYAEKMAALVQTVEAATGTQLVEKEVAA